MLLLLNYSHVATELARSNDTANSTSEVAHPAATLHQRQSLSNMNGEALTERREIAEREPLEKLFDYPWCKMFCLVTESGVDCRSRCHDNALGCWQNLMSKCGMFDSCGPRARRQCDIDLAEDDKLSTRGSSQLACAAQSF